MCFGSSKDGHNEEAPRPAQVLSQQQQSHAKPPSVKMSGPKSQYQQQQQLNGPSGGDDIAPPPGPPPSHQAVPANTDYAPPSGPPPSHRQQQQAEYAPPAGPPPSHRQNDDFAPPPGPPPARQQDDGYAPPSGPPPSQRQNAEYAPPPGPPPSHQQDSDFAPPSGPPPSHRDNTEYAAPPPGPPPSQKAKPQHDWETVVPDTSLFPPPPDIFSGFDRSPASNATEAQANAGEAWVQRYPLSPPVRLDAAALGALHFHNPRLMRPPQTYSGALEWVESGVWAGKTDKRNGDNTIIAYPPLYAVTEHSPLASGRPKTIYYEVRVRPDSGAYDTTLAIGYAALPYPTFRMPGWHRGSLAVHGDDGHKYINDRWGGKSFTAPFVKGETYGLGMTLAPAGGKINVDVFFTRDGKEAGRWNLHEETDAQQDLPVTGLEGFHDLSCAVGTFENVSFEIIFEPSRWMYQGLVE